MGLQFCLSRTWQLNLLHPWWQACYSPKMFTSSSSQEQATGDKAIQSRLSTTPGSECFLWQLGRPRKGRVGRKAKAGLDFLFFLQIKLYPFGCGHKNWSNTLQLSEWKTSKWWRTVLKCLIGGTLFICPSKAWGSPPARGQLHSSCH